MATKNIEFFNVTLGDGFWGDRYNLNAEKSVYAVKTQFEKTGRFEALRFTHKDNKNTPLHFYFDSDVAKWIEAVGYLLKTDRDKHAQLEKFCDELIDSLAKHQLENGYINSYVIQVCPEEIYSNRDMHELYCLGHFIEGAISYHQATNKDTLLNVVLKAIDHAYNVFVVEKSSSFTTCGHPEIELALIKLYEYLGIEKHLDLAEFFLKQRGNNLKDITDTESFRLGNKYCRQDHLPLEKMDSAEGHSVRAVYLYTAMAMLCKHRGDNQLFDACKNIFSNIVNKKMYITGGIGSTSKGECFETDYILPNNTAYNETCAGIGLINFCQQMLLVEHDSKYSNVIERVLYNNFLSSTSLDGRAFFYENPLEINLRERNTQTATLDELKNHYPITQRVEVFECSCCPPNVNRTLANLGSYAYTFGDNTVYVEQFINSKLSDLGLKLITTFPYQDTIILKGENYKFNRVAIRIPSWCKKPKFSTNYTISNGYAVFEVGKDFEIKITYNFQPKFLYSNSSVFSNVGKCALTFGPIVYCLEGVDNSNTLTDLLVNVKAKIIKQEANFHPLNNLVAKGYRIKTGEKLYSKDKPKMIKEKLTFIPYYTFANRGESNMQVWVNYVK